MLQRHALAMAVRQTKTRLPLAFSSLTRRTTSTEAHLPRALRAPGVVEAGRVQCLALRSATCRIRHRQAGSHLAKPSPRAALDRGTTITSRPALEDLQVPNP